MLSRHGLSARTREISEREVEISERAVERARASPLMATATVIVEEVDFRVIVEEVDFRVIVEEVDLVMIQMMQMPLARGWPRRKLRSEPNKTCPRGAMALPRSRARPNKPKGTAVREARASDK